MTTTNRDRTIRLIRQPRRYSQVQRGILIAITELGLAMMGIILGLMVGRTEATGHRESHVVTVRVVVSAWPDRSQPGRFKRTPSLKMRKGYVKTASWHGSRLRRSRSRSSSLSILSTFRGGMRQSAASIREIPVRRRDSRQLV